MLIVLALAGRTVGHLGSNTGREVCADETAHANSMGSRLPNASMRMSLLHAWYGAGATAGPFISTSFVKHVSNAFRFYLIAAGLAIIVVLTLLVVYELRTVDQIIKTEEDEFEESIPLNPTNGDGEDGDDDDTAPPKMLEKKKKQGSGDKMREILRMPSVYAIVFYMFIYVGPSSTPPAQRFHADTRLDRSGGLDRWLARTSSNTLA